MRYTEEHAYGYTVDLWRDGDWAIGLSFTAKLTTGFAVLPGGRHAQAVRSAAALASGFPGKHLS